MNIIVALIVIVVGLIFYGLSYVSPKTDLLLYGVAAVMFLVGGVLGMVGFNDYPSLTGNITITETNTGHDTTQYQIDREDTLKDSQVLDYIPVVFVLLSIYMLANIATTR